MRFKLTKAAAREAVRLNWKERDKRKLAGTLTGCEDATCPGWDIFNDDSEIQRCDTCEIFDDDEEAARHVLASAQAGDSPDARALARALEERLPRREVEVRRELIDSVLEHSTRAMRYWEPDEGEREAIDRWLAPSESILTVARGVNLAVAIVISGRRADEGTRARAARVLAFAHLGTCDALDDDAADVVLQLGIFGKVIFA